MHLNFWRVAYYDSISFIPIPRSLHRSIYANQGGPAPAAPNARQLHRKPIRDRCRDHHRIEKQVQKLEPEARHVNRQRYARSILDELRT